MITDSVYNAQGQVTYTDDPHLSGEPTNGSLTTYDQDGNVIGTEELAIMVITITTTGNVSTSAFAGDGGIISTTSTAYNAAGQVAQTTDASGMMTNNTYDNVGNLTSSTEIVNNVARTTSSTYNVIGEVTSTTDALGNTTLYQYNAAGQVTKTTFADGSSITDEYDSQGNKISEIDQNGIETDYQYNQYGELSAVIEPPVLDPASGQVVNPTYYYTYDIYGNQISTTDAEGHTTSYTFDAFGHMRTETLPMTQTEVWSYNAVGQLTSQTDFDGNVTDYTYFTAATAPAGVSPGQLEQKTIYAYTDQTLYETVTYAYNVDPDDEGDYHDTVTDTLAGVVPGRPSPMTSTMSTAT